ncbi:MAG: UDP-N-acetylmuramate--L-alanine ligase, partial [Muribaculaceae bacterium]|nr:UDP-N-acetylmuramate--L-alanine ligase [Muribaculaceae bacterium]
MREQDIQKSLYFVGAGGIGMANLVRYYLRHGAAVGGYDRTPSELTSALEKEGALLTFTDSEEEVPVQFRDPSETLVVYTP